MNNHTKKDDRPTYITIGKIGAPFGLKGWLKVHSYAESLEQMISYHPWYLQDKKSTHPVWEAVALQDSHINQQQLRIKLQGIDSPEAARVYTNKLIAITHAQLAPLAEGEYYWTDLVGLSIINTQNEIMGTVSYLISTGANDALVVTDAAQKQFAIPFLPKKTILKVDLVAKIIQVDWEPI